MDLDRLDATLFAERDLVTASALLDTMLIPFMLGATVSFGVSLFLLRETGAQASQSGGDPSLRSGQVPVWRKVILAGLGVVLGSIATVLGIAGLILISGI